MTRTYPPMTGKLIEQGLYDIETPSYDIGTGLYERLTTIYMSAPGGLMILVLGRSAGAWSLGEVCSHEEAPTARQGLLHNHLRHVHLAITGDIQDVRRCQGGRQEFAPIHERPPRPVVATGHEVAHWLPRGAHVHRELVEHCFLSSSSPCGHQVSP